MSSMENLRKTVNAVWVDYDKYNRGTWPADEDLLFFVEKAEGEIQTTRFRSDEDGPHWTYKGMEDEEVVVRYARADLLTFHKEEAQL